LFAAAAPDEDTEDHESDHDDPAEPDSAAEAPRRRLEVGRGLRRVVALHGRLLLRERGRDDMRAGAAYERIGVVIVVLPHDQDGHHRREHDEKADPGAETVDLTLRRSRTDGL